MPDKGLTPSSDPKVQYVVGKFAESRDYYKDLREKFGAWDDIYFNIPKAKKYDWMSNLFVPATHKAVMTLLSRIMNSLFSIDPNFDTVPSNKKLSDLLRSQLYKASFYTQYMLFSMQMLIRGTSIGKITWRKQKKTRFSLEKITENIIEKVLNELGEQATDLEGKPLTQIIGQKTTGYQKKPKEVVKYDGPVFETIDLFDFYPEPKAKGLLDGARIFRSVKTIGEFIRDPNFQDKDKVKETNFPTPDVFPHSRMKDLGIGQPPFEKTEELPTEEAKRQSGFVELLECETKWWNEKTKKLENWLLTIANREVVVRDEPNPYWNVETLYVRGTWIPILNEFYGIGIPELTESLQEELNDKRNQRIDNVNQILQMVFMYEEGAIDPRIIKTFERKPGAKLRLRPGGLMGVKWDVAPDVTSSATIETAELEKNIEEITGAVRQISPSSISGEQIHRTAQGLMLLQSMANERIKLPLKTMEKMVLEPIWEIFFELNLQFLHPGYKILNPEGVEEIYTPEDFVGDYEFRAKGSTYAIDQQVKLMNLMRFFEALRGIPAGEAQIDLLGRIYEALGFEDKKEIMEKLRKDIEKQAQKELQMEMAKKGAGQGGDDLTGLSNQMRASAGRQVPGGGI